MTKTQDSQKNVVEFLTRKGRFARLSESYGFVKLLDMQNDLEIQVFIDDYHEPHPKTHAEIERPKR